MYDIIIVGAGPAGSSAAYELAAKGLKTLFLEKKKVIGQPKQCAEGINKNILEELKISLKPEWIANPINSIVVSNGDYFIQGQGKRTQGYVLDRKKFDYGLAERAQDAGAELVKDEVVNLKDDQVFLRSQKSFSAKVIVGADGPLSVIGRSSGLGNPPCGSTLQYEIEKQTDFPHAIQCYFSQKILTTGWAWIFPKKDTMNVGIGSFQTANLKPQLEAFIKYCKLEKLRIREINAKILPLHGPLPQFQKDNVLLIGDAAGHTNPLSGGGIPVAIFDGQLIADVIAQHLENGFALENYPRLWWQSCFGQATRESLKAKEIYLRLLQTGRIDQFFNRAKNRQISSINQAWQFLRFVPLTSLFSFYRFAKLSLKSFEHAW